MYSRGLNSGGQDYAIPEKYDGTALLDLPKDDDVSSCIASPKFIDSQKKEIKFSPTESPVESEEACEKTNESESVGAFSFEPLKWVKSILPKGLNFGGIIPKLQLEELIILSLATFLFFSKSGDKECALILLSLMFIQ